MLCSWRASVGLDLDEAPDLYRAIARQAEEIGYGHPLRAMNV